MKMKRLQILITISALLIAAIHSIWPNIKIDAITLALIVIAILPWLAPILKSLELPGGWKIEYKDLKNTEEKVERAGLLASKSAIDKTSQYSFQVVAEDAPNLALAGLRIEIEKRLNNIAESNKLTSYRKSVGQLLRELSEKQMLTSEERSVLSDLIGLLNRAVHGGEVDPRAAQWAIDVGPRILKGLDERLKR
jgi:hypothetical protein